MLENKKKVDKALVDILKNYLANKTFSRGVETLGAEASMAFIGNTKHNVPYMLKYSDLFEELSDKYYDPAFIDRLHAFLPGWEVDIIRGEMFSEGYGFVVDYIAEILRHLRNQDFSDRYQEHFTISSDIATRDRDAVHKTFSGLMKVLFPNGEQTTEETEEILHFAMESRKRVKDQLMRIDSTFEKVDFSYVTPSGSKKSVKTLEEIEYPNHYYKTAASDDLDEQETSLESDEENSGRDKTELPQENRNKTPTTGHITVSENQRGITFDQLFSNYLNGAKKITLTDPYIRVFHQMRNLMEFVETLVKIKEQEDDIDLHLVTQPDDMRGEQQENYLMQVQQSADAHGINFTWEFDNEGTTHARHVLTDTGWKISLDRGLDIFQRYEMNDAFNLNNRLQETRACKAFEITYLNI